MESHLFSGSAREVNALRRIAATMGTEPHAVLQGLLAAAVDLCGGGPHTSTAGVSLLERGPDGSEQFRWVAMAGCLADHIGGTTPRDFSPCGECLDRGTPIILSRPDLKYGYLSSGGIEYTQGLVVPFRARANSAFAGTIWVISHPPLRHHFDGEDVRLMQTIAEFAAASYWMTKAFDDATRCRQVHEQTVTDMSREMRTPLNVIAASAYLLTLENPELAPGERAAHVERIERAGRLLLANLEALKGSAPHEAVRAGMNGHDTAALEVQRAIAEADLCERLLQDVGRAAAKGSH
ncbi:MAG TPA: GAF domain-containing protein [Gemmatimonadaceae bacterium]|nr:GAF domain-containing protein [Gemmatimonadaceae bacterium]